MASFMVHAKKAYISLAWGCSGVSDVAKCLSC